MFYVCRVSLNPLGAAVWWLGLQELLYQMTDCETHLTDYILNALLTLHTTATYGLTFLKQMLSPTEIVQCRL